MKKYFIAMILFSVLASPAAMAVGGYGGLSLGQVSIEDVDTGNLGIALGSINEHGLGFELVYAFSIIDDEESSGGVTVTADTDVIGLFAVYQTPGDVYLKAKAGYGIVNLKFEVEDLGTADDTTEGFAYGLAAGVFIGDGAIELTYFEFPEFDEFDDIPIDADVEFINLTYYWTF